MPKARPPAKKSKAARRRTTGQPLISRAYVKTPQDANLVQLGVAMGYSYEQIAAILTPVPGSTSAMGIGITTLKRYYQDELKNGAARVHARIAGNMAQIAMDRNHKGTVLAGIFWLKSRLGWQQSAIDVEVGFDGKRKKGMAEIPTRFTLRIGEREPQPDAPESTEE